MHFRSQAVRVPPPRFSAKIFVMEAGMQIARDILDAIRSGQDLYVLDRFLGGPHPLEDARKLLVDKRDSCSDPDEVAFLTTIIHGLDEGNNTGQRSR
jgi:hypothetical protein